MKLYNITVEVNESLYYLTVNKKQWLHELGPTAKRGKWKRKVARFHEVIWRIKFNRWVRLKEGDNLNQIMWTMGKNTITITLVDDTNLQKDIHNQALPSLPLLVPSSDKEEKPQEQSELFPYSP